MEVMEAKEELLEETKGKTKEENSASDEGQSALNKEEAEEEDFLQPYLHLLPPSLIELLRETRRDYNKQQFKNKWDSMKKEYTNWMTFKNKTTGLGWNDEANTVVADDDWWKKMGEENKEFLAFRKRGPEHLDEMSRMFENVLVTGESSFMPGTISGTVLPEGAELHNLDDDDDDEVHVTPSNRGKRGAGQLENPKKKNPVQRELKRMVDHMINEDASVASSKVTIVTETEKIMEEVVMCGAKEGSDEHYIATKLFAKLENRAFFRTFKTNDGKMNWLSRMYEDRRKN
ncbi:Zinc finger CCCH domain-containing protein 43 [Hordeum vulgare]|nr:Zinc finger CCCH domain-containing protein 43 [Hordeum vulgare]